MASQIADTPLLALPRTNMLVTFRPFRIAQRLSGARPYTTKPEKQLPFIYQYGTPLVKCVLIATVTNLALQQWWTSLEYVEYRKDMDAEINQLNDKIKDLEARIEKSSVEIRK
ncbi:hypothetical protein INT43_005548 [Umbelopsis isabellina]|uniref:Uncharacterized protein n=1 Tax=Mortierella isabellina TaxID=91625 RepID=A0A8H7PMT9_MORIS|nr:hypothetical protein INT43_005548 [Umbelopsis isabellina]